MRPRKILIIDDEPDLCHLMKSFLTLQGFNVYTSFTLKEGLEVIRTVTPEIIFLDHNLPDGFGWDHIDEIRQMVPQANIALMSAFKNSKDVQTSTPVYILEKPISLQSLTMYLSNVDKSLQHLPD